MIQFYRVLNWLGIEGQDARPEHVRILRERRAPERHREPNSMSAEVVDRIASVSIAGRERSLTIAQHVVSGWHVMGNGGTQDSQGK